MKLLFVIDKKYDIVMGKSIGYKEPFYSEVEKDYKKCKDIIEKTRALYQKSWNVINDEFSQYIERITGYKWFYPKYECVVSIAHKGGISNWGNGSKISFFWGINPYLILSGIAHELIISHFFEIYKKHYKKEGLKDRQVWALAEIAALALTSLTPEAKKFWQWYKGYRTNHNYPQIVPLQNKLKKTFQKRKNFDEYIEKGISLIKKDHPNGLNLVKSIFET